jgi:hypothetical protein
MGRWPIDLVSATEIQIGGEALITNSFDSAPRLKTHGRARRVIKWPAKSSQHFGTQLADFLPFSRFRHSCGAETILDIAALIAIVPSVDIAVRVNYSSPR